MPPFTLLVATWDSGLFVVTGNNVQQEITDQPVRGLAADGRGGALAIVGGQAVWRRSADGAWTAIADSEHALSCCLAHANSVFVGTDDARILRIDPDGAQHWLPGFDVTPGRDSWYAGSAIIDGRRVGPPLGVRSMTATCDGAVLLANVHVGGIPRSTDGGRSWHPTIAIESDVHQVHAHPTRPDLVIAAAAVGLCISRDAGATWSIEQRGLHALHCAAVACGRNDLFVSAATDPFAARGALYRRKADSDGPLLPLGGGLPEWIEGSADTDCIAARGMVIAAMDRAGCLYLSQDDGETWSCPIKRLPCPSSIFIV